MGTEGVPGASPTLTEFTGQKGSCSEGGTELKVGGGTATYACNGFGSGTLAKGKTEAGVWSTNFGASTEEQDATSPISFPIRLAAPANKIHYVTLEQQNKNTAPTECAGSAEAPTATDGALCIYEGEGFGGETARHPEYQDVLVPGSSGAMGVSIHGAELFMSYPAGSQAKDAGVYGTWAVTGE